ncbi:MAG: pyridoxal 5'-phosphate synthase glutaminase subunit PdxT [Prevotella sp.]|uniref:pyridoxal 5'-phosphate synthase glutaminase subunit PdxT n=1 Tax=Prevotella sp. TaxID=59823 RepID=UPI002A323755|nr:pyridoxal 5'-phosphate synthase glutaminase subunit PdxT [Prevotella sp.]MDD7317646.1 pyridoxal 5'-phosphate synthase glutaminase subunit PdxT [Prevotellaceae bacterium]MDY4020507.1 pyridoxal 5'-phosphate synthase glutaminase subunit PdxT [Prevotella sp.]
MRIAVLALQGAFIEHEQMLERLGVETFEVRKLSDWQQPKDAIIIPGGESTTMMLLLKRQGMLAPVREAIAGGMPVLGTCAGLILLDREHIGTMDILARRNAYGRQLGSFHTNANFRGIEGEIPMTFIRAPYIEEAGREVEILSEVDGKIVAARQGNQLVTAFHPELDDDLSLHRYFLNIVA